MRRFLRILWICIVALSLLSCLGKAAAWARQNSDAYAISFFRTDRSGWELHTGTDGITFYTYHVEHVSFPLVGSGLQVAVTGPLQRSKGEFLAQFSEYRFGISRAEVNDEMDELSGDTRLEGPYIRAVYWLPFVVTALAPALQIYRVTARRWNRWRRSIAPHSCEVCGYDLRATPDVCPECGTRPELALPKT